MKMPKSQQDKEKIWLAKDVQSRWQTAYHCAFSLLGRILQGKPLKEIADNRKAIMELGNWFASQVAGRIGLEFDRQIENDWTIEKQIRELEKKRRLLKKTQEEINKIEF